MNDNLRLGQNSSFNSIKFNQKKAESQQAEQNAPKKEQKAVSENTTNFSSDEVLNYLAQSSQVNFGIAGKSKKIEISKYVNDEQAKRISESIRVFAEKIFPTAVKELGSEELAFKVLDMM